MPAHDARNVHGRDERARQMRSTTWTDLRIEELEGCDFYCETVLYLQGRRTMARRAHGCRLDKWRP